LPRFLWTSETAGRLFGAGLNSTGKNINEARFPRELADLVKHTLPRCGNYLGDGLRTIQQVHIIFRFRAEELSETTLRPTLHPTVLFDPRSI
jgi:hypothetical protein